jgi:hypothetical protein
MTIPGWQPRYRAAISEQTPEAAVATDLPGRRRSEALGAVGDPDLGKAKALSFGQDRR